LLEQSFEFLFAVNRRITGFFCETFAGFLDLFGLLVALIDVTVILKIVEELAPRYELLVVDCIVKF
jgi:hypothetical protein